MLTKRQLSTEELHKIIGRFDLGKIEKIEPLATSGNIAYIIKTLERSYFLRLCPLGSRWRSPEEIAAELELINYLQAANFPVIGAVKDKDGKEIISRGKHNGYLREFIEAQEKLNPTAEEVAKFGEIVGWLHSLTENYQTKNKREHIFNLAETKAYFEENKEKILASDFKDKEKFINSFEAELNRLTFPDKLPWGMIHEDLGKRHAIWQEDEIWALIDFDRCYFGQLILDLGEACRGWCFINDWQEWSTENFTALIEGYQKKRKLTDLEKQLLPDAIKFGILELALSFCLRFINVTHDPEDEQFALESVFKQLDLTPKRKTI